VAGNPLVAAPVDTATAFSGASLLDDGAQLKQAVESGDWVMGGVAAFTTALDVAATVSDPLGSLIAHGLGWLMDHLEPLKGWLNDLTGDAGEVQAFSQTWANIAQQLTTSGQELGRIVQDVENQAGATMDAYRAFQREAGQHIVMAGGLASAFSTGLGIASTIVQVVHDLVRDAIAQIVGSAISWAAEAVFTVGLATPWIIEQVSTRVSSLVAKIGGKLKELLESVKALRGLLSKVDELLTKFKGVVDKALHGKASPLKAADDAPTRMPEGGTTTMRGYEIPAELSAAQRRQLEGMASGPDAPIVALPDGTFQMREPVDVEFTMNPNHDAAEFQRQLQLQNAGANDLSVAEWQHNVEHYRELQAETGNGRMGDAEQRQARIDAGGVKGDGKAVLHGPDQVAGGRPDRFDGLGDSGVNSSLGSQWGNKIDDVYDEVDAAVQGIDPALLPYIHLNLNLR
jgi:hypothetical protein